MRRYPNIMILIFNRDVMRVNYQTNPSQSIYQSIKYTTMVCKIIDTGATLAVNLNT